MLDIFNIGTQVYDAISAVGDFLMSKPLASWVEAYPEIEPFIGAIADTPIYMIFIGTGLIGFLTWKLISFVLDIWPG